MPPFIQKVIIIAESNAFTYFILRFLRRIKSVYRLLFSNQSILKSSGWIKSSSTLRPVDNNNEAIPWISYSAIHFIAKRIKKDMRVFEYGSGNSTIWWSSRVEEVTSVEHDQAWYNKVAPELPDNVNYIFQPLSDNDKYESTVSHSGQYDIIIVDGRRRIQCIKKSIGALTDKGIIILDNSDRERYREGIDFLVEKGYNSLEFSGLIAIGIHPVETSIFYKSSNVLDI